MGDCIVGADDGGFDDEEVGGLDGLVEGVVEGSEVSCTDGCNDG